MEMEVRYFLATADTIVLIEQDTTWGVGTNQRPRQTFGGSHHRCFFGFFQI